MTQKFVVVELFDGAVENVWIVDSMESAYARKENVVEGWGETEELTHYTDNLGAWYYPKGCAGSWGCVEIVVPQDSVMTDEEKHYKGVAELKKAIYKLLNTTDDEKVIDSWNEFVDNDNPLEHSKIFTMCKWDLSHLAECLSETEKENIISSLCDDEFYKNFNRKDKFFYATETGVLMSTNTIWDVVDCALLCDYLLGNQYAVLYGRKWVINNTHTHDEVYEFKVCEMPNGDEIWKHSDGYLVLYTKEQTYTSDIDRYSNE